MVIRGRNLEQIMKDYPTMKVTLLKLKSDGGDPAYSIEVIKRHTARLQHLCGQARLSLEEVEEVQKMSKDIARASSVVVIWAEGFR